MSQMEVSYEYELSYLLAFKYLNTVIFHPFHLSKTLMQLNYRPVPISPKVPRKLDFDTYLHEKNVTPVVGSVKRDGDGYAYTPYHGSILMTCRQQIKDHGILSLYSGHLAFYYISLADALVRPLIESLIAEYLGIDEFDPTWAMTFIKLAAHFATSLITLPLDILNTRQIAQHPKQETYITTTQGLKKISTWYTQSLVTTYSINSTVPFVLHKLSTFVSHLWFDPIEKPIRFSLLEFILNASGMLIELPLEAICKRQLAKDKVAYPTRVPLCDPADIYDGFNILYEETCFGVLPKSKKETIIVYLKMCRGWGMHLMVNGLIFISHVVMALDEKVELIEEPIGM
eukprot:NODE_639_length_5670_cov_0.131754.p1 type:complete len:343 gc:universal NODE_639_length_5670_cov_0.131754:793-1821(+)